jgi:hypothetical protein
LFLTPAPHRNAWYLPHASRFITFPTSELIYTGVFLRNRALLAVARRPATTAFLLASLDRLWSGVPNYKPLAVDLALLDLVPARHAERNMCRAPEPYAGGPAAGRLANQAIRRRAAPWLATLFFKSPWHRLRFTIPNGDSFEVE